MALIKLNNRSSEDNAIHGRRNLIINGGFDVWQRGTTFSQDTLNANRIYTADRWIFARNGTDKNCTATQVSGDLSQYAIKVQRDSGDTNDGVISISQFFETKDVIKLRGKNLVAKVRVKVGANYTGGDIKTQFATTSASESAFTKNSAGSIGSGNADYVSNSVSFTPTTSFADYTVDLGSVASTANVAMVRISYDSTTTGTAGADDSFTVDAVQLEIGTTATPFEHRSFGEELALCQRYYQILANNQSDTIGASSKWSTSNNFIFIDLPVEMRTQPTLDTNLSTITAAMRLSSMGYNSTGNNLTLDGDSSPRRLRLNTTIDSGNITSGAGGWLRINAGTIYVNIDAEL